MLHQAVAMQQNGAHAEAEDLYREILALRPAHFDAIQLLGALSLQTGRIDEGIELLKKAVLINGKHAPLHSNLAYSYNTQRRFSEGLASANRALTLQPGLVDALTNRGNALAGLGRATEALASFDKALALQPGFAQAWNNRACALRDLNRAVDAQANYRRALELAPEFCDAWSNLGLALIDTRQHEEALRSYERALALDPDAAEAHWNYSLCLLQMGRFDQGWREYEWRWQRQRIKASQRGFAQPLWLGDSPLDGKTILLHAEQGLGDTLQFCRYAPLVAAKGGKVILEVPAELTRLLTTLDGVAELVEQGKPLPAFDCHAPLLSLPFAFQTDLANIPCTTPYLFADRAAAQRWRERLASDAHAFKVGVVWAGGNRPHVPELRRYDARRSVTLDMLRPILGVPQVRFYSLQKGPSAQQLREAPELAERIVDHTDEFTDFADTAAFVDNLDLVITVDTAVAHLAGAMGKPVWIMNRFDTCWRWLLDRTDSPWYPDARLFRQPALGDWNTVIEAVRDALSVAGSPADLKKR